MVTAILVTAILLTSMNDRTEPNNFIGTNEYEILIRYYLIRFVVRSKLVRSVVRNFGSRLSCTVRLTRTPCPDSVSRLLVRYFWTGRKWFGSYWQVWWRQFKDVTHGDKKSLKNVSSSLLQAVAACCKLLHPIAAYCKLKPVASSCHLSCCQSSQ